MITSSSSLLLLFSNASTRSNKSLMSTIASQRRGSAASSVSVTIETTTMSTLATPGMEDAAASSTCIVTAGQTVDRDLPPLPADNLAPPPAPTVSTFPPHVHESSYRFPPPPPYAAPAPSTPGSSATVQPLSFFAFSSLTPVDTRAPDSTAPALPPPPSYAECPRTQAERHFWLGFLCPIFWFLGLSRLWRSEAPVELAKEKAPKSGAIVGAVGRDEAAVVALEAALAEAERWSRHEAVRGEVPEDVKESLVRWREEERIWAKRCVWAVAGMCGLGAVLGVMLASLLGKI
ncbi:hypothetical protein NBRC10512_000134 [Rhodotorula toruloides]|uniref:RHTO0S08e02828g1_1 n=2 Tax=Rhodotorula toruloides TaxID=5286 RepID=A0A061B276_RHOTO|nr:uncharacterized protein RHTO_03497 [Rhodotorula toruloides NP11]EMS20261.1 hypothetical protein RHTO_03497 [Rhodotorula toruloides NP11]CDR43540.1 RHTO0S08e02828g1_1 [Rhodotorula toruloides]